MKNSRQARKVEAQVKKIRAIKKAQEVQIVEKLVLLDENGISVVVHGRSDGTFQQILKKSKAEDVSTIHSEVYQAVLQELPKIVDSGVEVCIAVESRSLISKDSEAQVSLAEADALLKFVMSAYQILEEKGVEKNRIRLTTDASKKIVFRVRGEQKPRMIAKDVIERSEDEVSLEVAEEDLERVSNKSEIERALLSFQRINTKIDLTQKQRVVKKLILTSVAKHLEKL